MDDSSEMCGRLLEVYDPRDVDPEGLHPRTDERCPQCGGETYLEQFYEGDGRTLDVRSRCCEVCELFQCAKCRLWFPWSYGGSDDACPSLGFLGYELCDECWKPAPSVPQ